MTICLQFRNHIQCNDLIYNILIIICHLIKNLSQYLIYLLNLTYYIYIFLLGDISLLKYYKNYILNNC